MLYTKFSECGSYLHGSWDSYQNGFLVASNSPKPLPNSRRYLQKYFFFFFFLSFFLFSFRGLERLHLPGTNACTFKAPPDLKKERPLKRSLGQKVVEATVITHYRTALAANNCRSQPYLPRENLRHETGFTRLIFGGF